MPRPFLSFTLFVLGIIMLVVGLGLTVARFAAAPGKAQVVEIVPAPKPSDKPVQALTTHAPRIEQRAFVYVLENGSSVGAETALGNLTQEGWRIVNATGFTQWTSRQSMDAPVGREAASTVTISSNLAALLILEKQSP